MLVLKLHKHIIEASSLVAFFALVISCGAHTTTQSEEEIDIEESVEQILAEMESDPEYLGSLDSLAEISIGSGARTIDVLGHTVSWNGRLFMHNADWGTIFELPTSVDWKVDRDTWQAIVSFHGNSAWSADSLVYVSYYGGFQVLDDMEIKEYMELDEDYLKEKGFKITSTEQQSVTFGDTKSFSIITEARNDDNINLLRKEIYKDHQHVNHIVSVQWSDGYDQSLIDELKRCIDRFPFGPSGELPLGMCAI